MFLLGFAVVLESSQYSQEGAKVEFHYTNYGPLVAGFAMIALAIISLAQFLQWPRAQRWFKVGIAVTIIGLGTLHIARGVGAFASPPSQAGAPNFHETTSRSVHTSYRSDASKPKPTELKDARFHRLAKQCLDGNNCDRFQVAAEARCKRGNASSCSDLALLVHYLGATGKPDAAKAREMFERACAAKDDHACGNHRFLFGMASHDAKQRVPAAVRGILDRACKANNYVACYNLGVSLFRGIGGDVDAKAAETTLGVGCKAGHAPSCLDQGMTVYNSDRSSHANKVRARALFERGCKLGSGQSCWNVYYAATKGTGGPVDHPRAAKALSRACTLEHNQACKRLAQQTKRR